MTASRTPLIFNGSCGHSLTMTKITQLEDRGAAVAWSPVASHADFLALGAKDSAGIGFEDTGGELELCDLNLTCPEGSSPCPKIAGKIKTSSRFASIAWTQGSGAVSDRFKMGLVAGGMIDGTVHIWNPKQILKNEESALVASIQNHSGGAVKALQFSTITPNMMATGGSDGQVLITSLDAPNHPSVTMPGTEASRGAEVTQLAWNTQVAHIVASAAGDGAATIWDLNAKKSWCRLQAESSGIPISDIQWNPTQGLHLVTASGDDRNPLLKLWDLRASTTMPLATLSGHSQGILSLAWCPHDDTLLISCGKDNRTILWDLYTLQPIADIPNEEPDPAAPQNENSASSSLFSGGLGSSQQKRYDVQWSPLKRGVVSTCSFDRKVQVHSVIGLATRSGRPPKWLQPSSGVSCGFGGSVVSFSSNDKVVKIVNVAEEPKLVEASNRFEAEIGHGDTIGFCQTMASKASRKGSKSEAEVWGFMQVIFEANARQQLLEHLGFHADTIAQAAMEYSEDVSKGVEQMSIGEKSTAPMTKTTEDAVKAALIVGNFEAAVECCFRTGNLADALVLASCGGAELWSKTQERYFELEAKKRPFLSVVSAIIRNQLGDLVATSQPSRWQETLAILSTYGQSDEFPSLCIALGNRLEAVGDFRTASLCYMCSLSLDRAVRHWRAQLKAKNKTKGRLDLLALHDFVVKVTVFMKAVDSKVALDDDVAELFAQYANALSEQGLLVTAAKYAKGTSLESKILRDRLYRSRESPGCLTALGSAPEFPFSLVQVNMAQVSASSQAARQRQQKSYPQQQQQQQTYPQERQAASQTATVSQTHTEHFATQQTQPVTSSQKLPEGWIELQDPASGQTYYANQTTNQTTWERPQPLAFAPTEAAQASAAKPGHPTSYGAAQQPQVQQQQPTANGGSMSVSRSGTPSRVASKYGDGFVTSASHPELAQQYGNVGTSNPYTGAERPGTAAAVVALKDNKAPVSGTFDPNHTPELLAEHQHIKDTLLELASSLQAAPLTPADKKQLAEAEKGIAILLKRLSRFDIDADVTDKVDNIVSALKSRDIATALAVQTALVNSDWKSHKDWLKGMKFLIQLASKKFK